MSLSNRLNDFIAKNYKSTANFAKASKISHALVEAIIEDEKQPDNTNLLQFHRAGVNIDWLLTGYGNFFAKNSVGQALQQISNNNSRSEVNDIISRINQWIDQNFQSIQEFQLLAELSKEELEQNLNSNLAPTPEFMLALANAGCNVDWIMTGIGSPFASNPKGVILKMKNRNYYSENEGDRNLNKELNSFFNNLTRS